MARTVRYPQGGEGFYAIAGVVFQNGVAEVDELSHAQQGALAMIGATIDDEPVEAPADASPVAPPADPEPAPQPAADAPNGPEEIDSETSLQEAAAPHEATTSDSDTDGDTTLGPGPGRHADTSAEETPEA